MPDLSAAETSQVGIVFSGLLLRRDMTLSLFEDDREQAMLAEVVDTLNRKHRGAVSVVSMMGGGAKVPVRIAFGAPDLG